MYLSQQVYQTSKELQDFSPEFWPEPGILAVQVGVHLHVITEVEHLSLETEFTMLYDDNSLETNTLDHNFLLDREHLVTIVQKYKEKHVP